jgi:phage terminase large subunit
MVRFDKRWFNPLYFILNASLKDHKISKVFVFGGKSSAKTISIAQIISKEAYVKNASSIAFRKESTSIPTTLKKSFNIVHDKMYLWPGFDRQERIYKCKDNVSEIVLKGMDDEEKAKGIEGYKYVYFDELNQFEKGEYEQADLSLRGIPGQKLFGSWNPVDENSWVKTELVDTYQFIETEEYGKVPCENSFVKISSCGTVLLVKTTYEDNYWTAGRPGGDHGENREYGFRDEALIAKYEKLRTTNYNSYKVNVLGEYGKVVFGGEFLKCWKSEEHIGIYPYDPEQAIYLYFDENVNPYFPCGFFQPGRDEKSPRMIHYIAAKNPNNKISWMNREIIRKLTEWGHKQKVYIGGDATSKKDDVKQEKGDDMFKLIMKGLEQFNPEKKTGDSNPSVRMSADFFNSLLEGNIPGMSFGVDKNCRTPILDYENTKEDKNGKVDKKTVTDPVTKISYQPYGHFVDLTRYFLVDTYRSEYSDYQRGGPELPPIIGQPKNGGRRW